MRIFFSVGEPSGDLHGANLIRQLQQRMGTVETLGFGGPRMQSAGCHLLQDMTELAVMGLGPVLAKLPKFFALRRRAEESFRRERPDAVVLIDYPGFNWHVARTAKELGIPVFYYGLPQLWAWAPWRVSKVRRFVDHALCKLPFEEAWFHDRGCHATYVGHPYFDELRNQRLDKAFVEVVNRPLGRLVTILPGSRSQEVKNNLPLLLKAAERVREAVPDVRFAIASYNERQATMARAMVADGPLPIDVFVGRTAELIHSAQCCLACSGSVSLELLYHAKPTAIVYKMPWLMYNVLRRLLVKVKYITLVNLLATDNIFSQDGKPYEAGAPGHENVLFPEYPTWKDRSDDVARHAIEWLTDEPARQELIGRLQALRDTLTTGDASTVAAEYIHQTLRGQAQALPTQAAA